MAGVAAGIDISGVAVHAALIDSEGALLASGTASLDRHELRSPAAWWAGATAAFAGLGEQALLSRVRAVAVSGTGGTVVPLDVADQAIRPASLSDDPANPDAVAVIDRAAPPDSPARGGASPLAKALSWRLLPNLATVLHQADWLAGRMLGRFRASDWNNALRTGFDPAAKAWPAWLAKVYPTALLPFPHEPGRPLGQMSETSARALGLSGGVVVAAGTTSGCAAVLAAGADREGDGITDLGAALRLKQLSAKPLGSAPHGVYSHRLGALWLPGGASNAGGAALAQYLTPDQVAALSERIDPSQPSLFDLYPLPGPGERFPHADPSMQPRRPPERIDDAGLLHALLEGLARIEADGYARFAALGGPKLTRVFSTGAGAGNPAWHAIRARVLGVPLAAPRSTDPAVGAALLALRCLR